LTRMASAAEPQNLKPAGTFAIFRQGALTNLLNPKVALFFLAFMPQFIAPDCASKFVAFLALGLTFITTGTLWCVTLSWFSAAIGDRLRRTPLFEKLLNRVAGSLFVLLGIRLVATK
ncbi:MAG: LysE family translocator, partial [Akkermansiaceae bacterium]|nr:LysE family translocator [Akkermansiaceae bacterium]